MEKMIVLKVMRFLLNFGLFSGILAVTVYYTYTNVPELFGLKNTLVPFNGALFLGLILSLIMAGMNEIITLFMIRLGKGVNK